MAKRRARRWDTTFGQWVSTYGVGRLSKALEQRGQPITPKAVHDWISGRTIPRLDRAVSIHQLSGGVVRVEDILQHREDVRG